MPTTNRQYVRCSDMGYGGSICVDRRRRPSRGYRVLCCAHPEARTLPSGHCSLESPRLEAVAAAASLHRRFLRLSVYHGFQGPSLRKLREIYAESPVLPHDYSSPTCRGEENSRSTSPVRPVASRPALAREVVPHAEHRCRAQTRVHIINLEQSRISVWRAELSRSFCGGDSSSAMYDGITSNDEGERGRLTCAVLIAGERCLQGPADL
jgi:hypothetical protein